jgi:hypothetical protein
MTRRPTAIALRALGLGDFVSGLPGLRLLRDGLPRHRLILAAPAAFRDLLELGVPVDALLSTGELEPIGYRGSLDIGIDLHGNGPASRELLRALAPRTVIGFANSDAQLDGPRWIADEHETTRWCWLVSEGVGVPMPPTCTVAGALAVPSEANWPHMVVVHPGAASGSRRWPAERFTAVAKALVGRGESVVVTASRAEAHLARRVAVESGAGVASELRLRELFGVIAQARLVISGDTGVSHVASVYRTPSLVLMGPVSPRRWGPPEDPRHVVLWHGDGAGDPHGAEPDPALMAITVDEVMAAVDTVLPCLVRSK